MMGNSIINCVGGDEEDLRKLQENDKIKTCYAVNNGINFLRVRYDEDHLSLVKKFIGDLNA